MREMFIYALFIAIFVVLSSGDDSGTIVELTSEAFDATVAKGDWMVKFHVPWCGHCKKMEPAYRRAADTLKGEVNVASVDATQDRALAARFHITGYPSIFFIRQNEVRHYTGSRTAEALVYFSKKGWQKVERMGFLDSPFSIVGRTKGQIIGLGLAILQFYNAMVHEHKYHWLLVSGVIVIVGICLTFFFGAVFAWLATSKEKRD